MGGSHDQQVTTIRRSRRQQVPDDHIVIVGSGSGSGVGNVIITVM